MNNQNKNTNLLNSANNYNNKTNTLNNITNNEVKNNEKNNNENKYPDFNFAANNTNTPIQKGSNKGIKIITKVGIIAGSIIGFFLFVLFCKFLYKKFNQIKIIN